MKKKRVTLFCSSYPPETGAAPGRMFRMAKLLKEQGYDVSVISAMPNYPTGKIFAAYRGKVIHKEIIDGIPVSRIWLIPTHSSNKSKRAISLLSYCVSMFLFGLPLLLKSKPDLIIISSPPMATGYVGLLLAKFTKAKTILNVSDLWPKTALDLGIIRPGRLYDFLKRRERKMYQLADAFSAQSEFIKQHINCTEEAGTKKTFVYRNLQEQTEQAIQERPGGRRKIVYAGLLGIAQGLDSIIKNIDFSKLDTELHLYGQGNESDKINDWIATHPKGNVFYHGSVQPESVPELLSQYHAMLIPLSTSIDGAVPSKIFNAMANGLPILFSGNGEAADIVASTQTGLVNDAGDFAALQKNIERLLAMPQADYEKMRDNCIRCNENEFNKLSQDKAFILFLTEQ